MTTQAEAFSGFAEPNGSFVKTGQLARTIADQICRQYRLYDGQKWADSDGTEVPVGVVVHIDEIADAHDRFGDFERMVMANAFSQDVVVVRFVMKEGEYPMSLLYTGDVVVQAKPLKVS